MNLITQTIALPDLYTVPRDQIAERDALIAKSQQYCGGVVSADGQSTAVEFGQAIHRQIKAVQEARLELAKPLNKAAKELIALEYDYLAPLIAEKDRLGRLVSAYQTAEAERVAREEREHQAEFQRLEQERMALERKAAQEAPGSAKAIKLEQKAADAMEAAATVLMAPPVEVSKAKGAVIRGELMWEVTDEVALYKAAAHLFTKPELKKSAVKSCCSVDTVLPGIRFWEETKANFRA